MIELGQTVVEFEHTGVVVRAVRSKIHKNRANCEESMKIGMVVQFDLLYILANRTKKSDPIMTS